MKRIFFAFTVSSMLSACEGVTLTGGSFTLIQADGLQAAQQFNSPQASPSNSTPLPSPSPVPLESASAQPAPSSKPVPSPEPWASAMPTATPAPTIAGLAGQIFDDDGQPLRQVKLLIRNLDQQLEYTTSTGAVSHQYVLSGLRCGQAHDVMASKEGFTSSRIAFVPDCIAGPEGNIIDFGGTRPEKALSRRPRVIGMTPAHDTRDLPLDAPITLTFSRPMDKLKVGEQLRFYFWSETGSVKLSVDLSDAESTFKAVTNVKDPSQFQRDALIGKGAALYWNSDGTELKLDFSSGINLPGDKKGRSFALSFDGPLVSQDRFKRESDYFDLDYQGFSHGVAWHTQPETSPLKVLSLAGQESGFLLKFNKPLMYYADQVTIAGGMAGRFQVPGSAAFAPLSYDYFSNVTEHAVAANYKLRIGNEVLPRILASWKALGGTVGMNLYDYQSPTRSHAVILYPPLNRGEQNLALFPSHTEVCTQALGQTLATDAQDNGVWRLELRPVGRTGTLGESVSTQDLETAEALDAEGFAAQLEAALQGLNQGEWEVRAQPDQQSVCLKYQDPSGETIGWELSKLEQSGPDALPASLATTPTSWMRGERFNWFRAGEFVEAEVATTVMDPAGNSLDPTARHVGVQLP